MTQMIHKRSDKDLYDPEWECVRRIVIVWEKEHVCVWAEKEQQRREERIEMKDFKLYMRVKIYRRERKRTDNIFFWFIQIDLTTRETILSQRTILR